MGKQRWKRMKVLQNRDSFHWAEGCRFGMFGTTALLKAVPRSGLSQTSRCLSVILSYHTLPIPNKRLGMFECRVHGTSFSPSSAPMGCLSVSWNVNTSPCTSHKNGENSQSENSKSPNFFKLFPLEASRAVSAPLVVVASTWPDVVGFFGLRERHKFEFSNGFCLLRGALHICGKGLHPMGWVWVLWICSACSLGHWQFVSFSHLLSYVVFPGGIKKDVKLDWQFYFL